MNQLDWIGGGPQPKPFKDIRNTRQSVAEEKAQLALQLTRLLNTIPPSVRNGSVNVTRNWRAAREAALKVSASSRSSVQDLSLAIRNMRSYE